MPIKTVQEIGQRLGYTKATARNAVERLIQEGRLRVVPSASRDKQNPDNATLVDLLTQGDELSQRAAALIQALADQCERCERDLAEWREIQAGRISDTTDPMTKTRVIVVQLP